MFEKVLLPLGSSDDVMDLFEKIFSLFPTGQGLLFLLSVDDSIESSMTHFEGASLELTRALERFSLAGIQWNLLERKGDRVLLICDVAEELNVDVIVLRTEGTQLIEEINNTVTRVLERSPCPVFLVP